MRSDPAGGIPRSTSYQRYLNRWTDFDRALWLHTLEGREAGKLHLVEADDDLLFDLQALDWDGRVLGTDAARVNHVFFRGSGPASCAALVSSINSRLNQSGARFCSFRMDASNLELSAALVNAGWRVADELAVFAIGPDELERVHPRATPEPYRSGPTSPAACVEFFRRNPGLFLHGRVHRDPNIPGPKAVEFYAELANFIATGPGAACVGMFTGDRMVGAAVGSVDEGVRMGDGRRIGYLWQIAIEDSHRGRGLAEPLLARFLEQMRERSGLVEIGTQIDNAPAMSLYRGFRRVAEVRTFHRWAG